MSISDLLSPIALRLTGSPLDASRLAETLIEDGGLDIEPLTKKDLIALLEGNFSESWKSVRFSCSELLNSYTNLKLTDYQVLGWCFVALALGEAVSRKETDLELHTHSVARGFPHVTSSLTYQEFQIVLKNFLAFDAP